MNPFAFTKVFKLMRKSKQQAVIGFGDMGGTALNTAKPGGRWEWIVIIVNHTKRIGLTPPG